MFQRMTLAALGLAATAVASPLSSQTEVVNCILLADVQEYPMAGDCSHYHANYYAVCEDGTIYYMGGESWETCTKVA